MTRRKIPTFEELMEPTIQALRQLGGSASIDELVPQIVRATVLPQDIVDVPHGASGRTELEYRSAWARTYLRKAGLIENSERGVWALTPDGLKVRAVNGREIARAVARQLHLKRSPGRQSAEIIDPAGPEPEAPWQDRLLAVLRSMDPVAFERLCQRLLRESDRKSTRLNSSH